MRLLYITNQIYGSGGLERVLSVKANYLADILGYEIHIITLNQRDKSLFYNFSESLNYHDISVRQNNSFLYIFDYIKGIKRIINKIQPDVISVCDDGLKGMLFPVIFGKKIPVIFERHVSRQIEFRSDKISVHDKLWLRIKALLMNYGGSKFHKFIVLTKGNLKEWNLNNLMVIPNPLPFYDSEFSELNSKNILVVGKQSYQKGYDRLLEIWRKVHQDYPDWKLDIYGVLDPNSGLEELVKDFNIGPSVNFYPPVKDIGDKYKCASIYLMTSRFEGFGMVLIEAMSYGVPCISFDCPYGPSDIILDGVDGFLVSNGDIDLFADRIKLLIKDSNKRSDMGKLARKNVLRYSPAKVVNQWDNLFRYLTT
ncbi:glycosyltransferase family 4 protein [Ancylomarina sp. 16SWW S1-10-2]|uniref:glycosyltransferase family 4 protein n=1 Tax=Ancylomarina sp. 16SWW S1-10-2 TaxID=2499681 RepID=UPI0012ADCD4B|nr:glycosyltransferase family 4 protein [Ancylomarina sp. 16SWW S1-10-2]MRT93432.1 glycosyltransferase family 4 protein [Ancylomarina sp. 16SWW S1-10-2]